MRDQDYSCASEFLARFFAGTDHAVELRALGDSRPAIRFTRDSEIVSDFCIRYDGPGSGCYFAVATRRNGSHRGDRPALCELAGVWCEIDGYKFGVSKQQATANLLSSPIAPTLIIDSGGGVQSYWLFREAMDVRLPEDGRPDLVKDEVDAVLKQLAGVFAGDVASCDITRILRLPGTHNWKTGSARPVLLLHADWDRRYEFSDLVETLDWLRPLIEPARNTDKSEHHSPDIFADFAARYAFKPPIDVETRLRAMSYMGDGAAGIHQTQLQVSASLVTHGAEDDEVVELLLAATQNAAGIYGSRWNWKREEANLRRMCADWRAKLAAKEAASAPLRPAVIQLKPVQQSAVPDDEIAPELGGYYLNDLGNAQRLIALHKTALRFVVGIGWHVWDGKRYAFDPALVRTKEAGHDAVVAMVTQAMAMPTIARSQRKNKILKFAIGSGMASKILAMLSSAEPYLCCQADDLDRDPWLLNCQNGTVDLRNGELRPHSQADLLSKLSGTDYDPRALCPQWDRFLLEIFDEEEEVVAFVQRMCGYTLTGMTTEQVILILHGGGSNGKSVFVEIIAAVMGDYTTRSPADTWVSKHTGGPSNDVAALAGARFVPVIETEREKQLAEALVKQATGGDAMTARFHYKEFFSFSPKFKLWFATNHKPRIRGSDYAIWRRILLLLFGVTFVDADKAAEGQKIKDVTLRDKLNAELPGILAWMVRGCLDWQRTGLRPPASVVHATESYQDSQDNVSGFVRDACHVSPGLTCTIGLLHTAYELWCETNDETPLDKRQFGKNLDERGFPPGERNKISRMRKGIDIKEEYRKTIKDRDTEEVGNN